MKFALLFTSLFLIYQTVFGQLRGTVYSAEGGPIENATVQLWASPKDSTIIAQTLSDARGGFSLPAQAKPHPIRVMCLGYEMYTAMSRGVGVLDTIVLRPSHLNISEVRIGASHRIFTREGITIHNTASAIRHSLSGLDLIAELNVPRVYVDSERQQIQLLGGGQPKILVNGAPATYGELRGLDPKWIQKIQYTNDPDAKDLDAKVVVEFIVDRPVSGGGAGTDLWNGLTTVYGEDHLYAQAFSRRHSLELTYGAQFRHTNTRVVFNEEEYHLPDRTVRRTEAPTPAKFAYLNQRATLRYKWFNADQVLVLTAGGQFDREWNNDYAGVGRVRERSKGGEQAWQYRFAEHQSGRLTAPEASAYYSHDFQSAGQMQLLAYGGYGEQSALYTRREARDDGRPFETSQETRVRPMQAGSRLRYGIDIPLADAVSLSTSASAEHRMVRLQTAVAGGSWSASNSQEYTQGFLRARLKFWGMRISASLGAHRGAYSQHRATRFGIMPGASFAITPVKWWYVSFDWYEPYQSPEPSQLNAQGYWLTPFLQIAGNPDLVASRMRQFTLNMEFYPHRKVNIFLQGKLVRIFNMPFEHTSLARLANGDFYLMRRFESLERTQRSSINLSVNTSRLWDLLALRLSGSMDHISSQHHGAFRHHGWYPQVYTHVAIMWKGFYLQHNLWYGSDFALQGDKVLEEGLTQRIEFGMRKSWIQVAVGVNGFLSEPKHDGERSLSPLHRYESYREYTALNNMLYAKLSLHFNWGTEWDVPEGDEGETLGSGVLQFNR